MKTIKLLFEVMVKYQEIKYQLKRNYEIHKMELKIAYNEYLKDSHNK